MDDAAARIACLEAQLAELESLYRQAAVGLCFVDRDLRYRRINERLAAINGRPVSDHIGRTVREMIPDLAAEVTPVYERVLRTGEPIVDVEVRGSLPSDPDVEHVWLVSYHPVRASDGEIRGVTAVVADITDVKRSQEALALATDRLQEAQRVAGVGSWEWDILEDEVWWSEELYRLMRKRKGEFTPSLDAFYEIIHPGDRPKFRRQIEATLARDAPYAFEFRALLDDGDERYFHASAALERTPDGVPARLVGTVQDLTQRLQERKERKRATFAKPDGD
jgi:two-component system CheB/CheR fusion protein